MPEAKPNTIYYFYLLDLKNAFLNIFLNTLTYPQVKMIGKILYFQKLLISMYTKQ